MRLSGVPRAGGKGLALSLRGCEAPLGVPLRPCPALRHSRLAPRSCESLNCPPLSGLGYESLPVIITRKLWDAFPSE